MAYGAISEEECYVAEVPLQCECPPKRKTLGKRCANHKQIFMQSTHHPRIARTQWADTDKSSRAAPQGESRVGAQTPTRL